MFCVHSYQVSGVPPLEVRVSLLLPLIYSIFFALCRMQESGDKKFGQDPKWKEYKK